MEQTLKFSPNAGFVSYLSVVMGMAFMACVTATVALNGDWVGWPFAFVFTTITLLVGWFGRADAIDWVRSTPRLATGLLAWIERKTLAYQPDDTEYFSGLLVGVAFRLLGLEFISLAVTIPLGVVYARNRNEKRPFPWRGETGLDWMISVALGLLVGAYALPMALATVFWFCVSQ